MDLSFDNEATASQILAVTVEQTRRQMAAAQEPGPELKQIFIKALVRLIREAMGVDTPVGSEGSVESTEHPGDPVFQSQVLRYQSALVDEYVHLADTIKGDRQQIVKGINAVAHPGKQRHMPSGWQRDAMVRLHRAVPVAESGSDNQSGTLSSWSDLAAILRSVLAMPAASLESGLGQHLSELLYSPALQRLQKFESLSSEDAVLDYLALCNRQGPPAGSKSAVTQGSMSRQRGKQVEARAAMSFRTLVDRMNKRSQVGDVTHDSLRVVTSLHVPAILAGLVRRAKTEWDVVVLGQANADATIWDVQQLVEVKASADAAVTDLPRLLRGVELLSHADADHVYVFASSEGDIRIRGASLATLSTDDATLKKRVRYWCESPSVLSALVLNPANRTRLLSAPACLEFASGLTKDGNNDPSILAAVWEELLTSPRLQPVLYHYPLLQQVRGLTISCAFVEEFGIFAHT